MKSDIGKRSMSVALVMAAILALVVPVAAGTEEIPPGPATTLPDYIGAPAKPHPTANSGVPQNPFLAPNPFNTAHVDPWMSDTVDIAGPLGRDPEVLSSTLAEARNDPINSVIFQCVGAAFDSHGHLITACTGTGPYRQEASVVLADATSLEVLAYYHLPTPEDPLKALSACYWFFDNQDRFTISEGPNRIITLAEGGSEASPALEPQGDGYDLSGVVPDGDRIAGVMADWQGRIWFATTGAGEDTAKACVLNPATFPDTDVKCQPLGENTTEKHERIFNTFAVDKTGAYIVTSQKMYRVWADSDDQPYVVWSEPYDTIGEVRPGQYELGSGTSPTILGEGKYVAITDNAEQLQVVVFRTDERLGPKETRKVCEVPVFDFEGGGAGANSNSLIGSRLSLIAENTYGYAMNWQLDGKLPSAPGFERIDINPNGKDCTKVWSNPDVASTISGKLSTQTGLIYIYARKMENNLDVYYLTALDFRTGEVVWEKKVGAGFAFDHFYTALLVGPDETIYAGLYGGLMAMRDTRWSALDKVDAFKDTLEKAGFGVEEGVIEFWDLVKDTCEGKLPDALANNPWPNAYISMVFEPHEGVETPPVEQWWQLREDEAIVLVGQTPPAAAYFSYQTFVGVYPGALGRIGAPVGDTINIGTVHTIGPDRVERPIIIIITGHRETERRVRAAARAAGYPNAIINVETISPVIAPLGISRDGAEASWFGWVHRVAVPEDKTALEEYTKAPPYEVFRVTPVDPATGEVGTEPVFAPNPEPVPVLRVRGTGHTEMELYPALKRLRAAILEEYGTDGECGAQCKELDTHIWTGVTRSDHREFVVEKPYAGLQRGIQLLGAGRDTNYLATYPNFMLREGTGEFVIVYGVNHQATGKVTYSSVSIYADKDRWMGPKGGTMLSPDFEGSAERYLPGDPDAQYLYAIKVARHCETEDLPYCMEVKQPEFVDINGVPYECELGDFLTGENPHTWTLDEHEMFFLFRSYMEPATNVSPDDNELLYDRAIYFGP